MDGGPRIESLYKKKVRIVWYIEGSLDKVHMRQDVMCGIIMLLREDSGCLHA